MDKFNDFQAWTDSTAIYPNAGKGNIEALTYVALGLAGETGEVVEKIKKLMRDGDTPERRTELAKELGDVLHYVARMAREMGLPLSQVAQSNVDKITSRQQRNQLQGSGDNR